MCDSETKKKKESRSKLEQITETSVREFLSGSRLHQDVPNAVA